ncbi:hypothetical protein BMS3Abin10_00883 [bacterium BMS3Abin10]|nr:hypothetical protein BMS3Abin10_00883 [bacterium BMS3Abin10]GBE39980.1 hypothetical protein BMS3Bbin08_02616 [bacterium BMS3Bbin08]
MSCPIWQQSHEILMTFAGRALALQAGAEPEELKDSVGACLLCGSCEPACGMGIQTVDITLKLREALNNGKSKDDLPQVQLSRSTPDRAVLIPDTALLKNKDLLGRTLSLLDIPLAEDNGSDILEAFENGRRPISGRVAAFYRELSGMRKIVVSDGLFKRYIRAVLPGLEVIGLGEALLRLPIVRSSLRPTDLYIIEARAFNADFKRCLPFYTEVRKQTGCIMNLDLQRIAIPTGACCKAEFKSRSAPESAKQISWILDGRSFDRVVAETAEDIPLLKKAVTQPVMHVAELADGETL